ncbi:MAG TPA: T9SS type A sorting domain-containing protein [Chitinophagales bacterium]|nr:T9SS type A sorting domain-containing protein [Chitinophagales bacterium]
MKKLNFARFLPMFQPLFVSAQTTPSSLLLLYLLLALHIWGGGNVLMGQNPPQGILSEPSQALVCPGFNCNGGFTGCDPLCCQEFCLNQIGNLPVTLRILPISKEELLTTNNNYVARFFIYRYPDNFSTVMGFNIVSASPFPIPGTVNYPASYTFNQPGYYLIVAEVWTIDPITGALGESTEGLLAPSPPPACLHLLDNELTPADVNIYPQQPTYCIGDVVTLDLSATAGYQGIEWQVNGITQVVCFESSGGVPLNPLINCNQLEIPFNQIGTYTVTLLTSNACEEEGQVDFPFTVIECCPPELPPVTHIDTPFELQCCMDATQFILSPASPNVVALDGRPAYVVGASATWTRQNNDFVANYALPAGSDVLLNTDLVIPSGITLTLSDINLFMGNTCRIWVQPNGKLIINETAQTQVRIAGVCNAMWQGIQAQGPGSNTARSYNAAANALNFGAVYVAGNVQIQDALFGISGMCLPLIEVNNVAAQLTGITLFPGADFFPTVSSQILFSALNSATAQNTSGGMMFVHDGATLLNCMEGINMSWYAAGCNLNLPNPNLPAFIGCQNRVNSAIFESTQLVYPFNTPGSPLSITEAGIHTIRYQPQFGNNLLLLNNQFNNLRYASRSIAIDNTAWVNNQVANCEVGVSIANYNFNSPIFDNVTVRNNTFNNCNTAIQAARTRLNIAYNNINTGYTPPNGTMGNANPIGIFVQGSDFTIAHNIINFTKCGIALLSNSVDPSEVNNNYINTCGIGVWALGNNHGTQIYCNQIINYALAIAAQDYTNPPAAAGLLDDQGGCEILFQYPADNLFQSPITIGAFTGYELLAAIPPANNFAYYYRNQAGYIPQLFAGEVTPVVCEPIGPTPLPPAEERCGPIPQPRPDEEIKALTDERLLNQEALRKVRYYLYEAEDTLAALQLLQDINTDVSRRFLAPHYLFQANTAFADSVLATLPDARLEDLHYQWLYGIYRNLRISGRDIVQLNAGEEDTIRLIANTTTQAAFEARTILYLLHGEEYPVLLPPMPAIINPALMQGVAINFKNGQTNSAGGNEEIINKPYPNPANGTINIAYQLNSSDIAVFRLFDFTGRIVLESPLTGVGLSTFEVSHLPKGVYLYQVLLNSEGLFNGKLILTN